VKGDGGDKAPGPPEPIGIVQATAADAQEIGALRARNWEEQYAHLDGVTKDWMNAEVERIAGEEGNRSRAHWIEQSNLPGAKNYWLIARLENGALAGFLRQGSMIMVLKNYVVCTSRPNYEAWALAKRS
jgi:hypothetical protein